MLSRLVHDGRNSKGLQFDVRYGLLITSGFVGRETNFVVIVYTVYTVATQPLVAGGGPVVVLAHVKPGEQR